MTSCYIQTPLVTKHSHKHTTAGIRVICETFRSLTLVLFIYNSIIIFLWHIQNTQNIWDILTTHIRKHVRHSDNTSENITHSEHTHWYNGATFRGHTSTKLTFSEHSHQHCVSQLQHHRKSWPIEQSLASTDWPKHQAVQH